ncbi:MAG: winged helix-turn-helix domain-containing protein, partial [Gammaproteobacteria bacterium]
ETVRIRLGFPEEARGRREGGVGMERGPQWEFAPFRLDRSGGMLWRENHPVALPPRAFSVLCHLVEHTGALVTKDEVLDAVWQHRFVSESVLKVCINELRRWRAAVTASSPRRSA